MDESVIEMLSERVHIGWMQEKQRQGFADHAFDENCHAGCGPGTHSICSRFNCFKDAPQHHPDMLPYADLAEHVKADDRATVRAVLSALEAEGFTITPGAPAPAPASAHTETPS